MGGDDGCGVDADNGHADDELGEKSRKTVTDRSCGGLAVRGVNLAEKTLKNTNLDEYLQ